MYHYSLSYPRSWWNWQHGRKPSPTCHTKSPRLMPDRCRPSLYVTIHEWQPDFLSIPYSLPSPVWATRVYPCWQQLGVLLHSKTSKLSPIANSAAAGAAASHPLHHHHYMFLWSFHTPHDNSNMTYEMNMDWMLVLVNCSLTRAPLRLYFHLHFTLRFMRLAPVSYIRS